MGNIGEMEATRVYTFLLVFVTITAVASALAQRTCSSQTQCHSNECCVTNNPPRGKRWLSPIAAGHCVAMGTQGSDCMVNSNNYLKPPSGVVYTCPCEQNLHCKGNGMIEVPLGEHGTCI